MYMRMMRECRSPGVQHQGCTDAGAQMLRVSSDGQQGLSGQIKQQAIDQRFVLIGDLGNRSRQREYHMVVLHRQQIALPRLEPAARSRALALGAMAVAAGVVGDLVTATTFTAQYMSPQRRAAALLDGRHDLELAQA